MHKLCILKLKDNIWKIKTIKARKFIQCNMHHPSCRIGYKITGKWHFEKSWHLIPLDFSLFFSSFPSTWLILHVWQNLQLHMNLKFCAVWRIWSRVAHFLVFQFPVGKRENWSISWSGKTRKTRKNNSTKIMPMGNIWACFALVFTSKIQFPYLFL